MPECHQCDLALEGISVHAFYHCHQVHPFWNHDLKLMTPIDPKHPLSIDIAYTCDNVSSLCSEVRSMVFLMLLTRARMVVYDTDGRNITI